MEYRGDMLRFNKTSERDIFIYLEREREIKGVREGQREREREIEGVREGERERE